MSDLMLRGVVLLILFGAVDVLAAWRFWLLYRDLAQRRAAASTFD